MIEFTESQEFTAQNFLSDSNQNILKTDTFSVYKDTIGSNNKSDRLVIIDSAVSISQQQIETFLDSGAEIVKLDANRDGILQTTDILANYQNINTVDIISHGSAGHLQLGNAEIDSNTLARYRDSLVSWNSSLTQSADILLYGCNVGLDGGQFVRQLGNLTGADIAASDDLTGNAIYKGDWELEYQTGQIEANSISINGLESVLDSNSSSDNSSSLLKNSGFDESLDNTNWSVGKTEQVRNYDRNVENVGYIDDVEGQGRQMYLKLPKEIKVNQKDQQLSLHQDIWGLETDKVYAVEARVKWLNPESDRSANISFGTQNPDGSHAGKDFEITDGNGYKNLRFEYTPNQIGTTRFFLGLSTRVNSNSDDTEIYIDDYKVTEIVDEAEKPDSGGDNPPNNEDNPPDNSDSGSETDSNPPRNNKSSILENSGFDKPLDNNWLVGKTGKVENYDRNVESVAYVNDVTGQGKQMYLKLPQEAKVNYEDQLSLSQDVWGLETDKVYAVEARVKWLNPENNLDSAIVSFWAQNPDKSFKGNDFRITDGNGYKNLRFEYTPNQIGTTRFFLGLFTHIDGNTDDTEIYVDDYKVTEIGAVAKGQDSRKGNLLNDGGFDAYTPRSEFSSSNESGWIYTRKPNVSGLKQSISTTNGNNKLLLELPKAVNNKDEFNTAVTGVYQDVELVGGQTYELFGDFQRVKLDPFASYKNSIVQFMVYKEQENAEDLFLGPIDVELASNSLQSKNFDIFAPESGNYKILVRLAGWANEGNGVAVNVDNIGVEPK